MPNVRLGKAMIFAKDLQRMAEFYHEALGLPLIPGTSAPGWVELDAGGVRLAGGQRVLARAAAPRLTALAAVDG